MACYETCVETGKKCAVALNKLSCSDCGKVKPCYNIPGGDSNPSKSANVRREEQTWQGNTCNCEQSCCQWILSFFGLYKKPACCKEKENQTQKFETLFKDSEPPQKLHISRSKSGCEAEIQRFGARTRSFEKSSKTELASVSEYCGCSRFKDICRDRKPICECKDSDPKSFANDTTQDTKKDPNPESATQGEGKPGEESKAESESKSKKSKKGKKIKTPGATKTASNTSTGSRGRSKRKQSPIVKRTSSNSSTGSKGKEKKHTSPGVKKTGSDSSTVSNKGKKKSASKHSICRSRSPSVCSATRVLKPFRRRKTHKSSSLCSSVCSIPCHPAVSPCCQTSPPPPCCNPVPCCLRDPCCRPVCCRPIPSSASPSCTRKEENSLSKYKAIRRSHSMSCGSSYPRVKTTCNPVSCGICPKKTTCCGVGSQYRPCCPRTSCGLSCDLPDRSHSFHSTLTRGPSPRATCNVCCSPCTSVNPCGRSRCRLRKSTSPVVCPTKKARSCPRPCLCPGGSCSCTPVSCGRSCTTKQGPLPGTGKLSRCAPGCCKPCCKPINCPPCCTRPCCLPCPRKFTVFPYCPRPCPVRLYASIPKCTTGSPCPCPAGCCSCPSPKKKYSKSSCCNTFQRNPVCSIGSTGSYYKSKNGDAICQMLLSKYNFSKPPVRCCPPICTGASCSVTPCTQPASCNTGGCKMCIPFNMGPRKVTNGCPACENYTNSRKPRSPERRQEKEISFNTSPCKKEPQCSFYLKPHCIRKTGPRSSVAEYLAKLKVPKKSPIKDPIEPVKAEETGEGKDNGGVKSNKDKDSPKVVKNKKSESISEKQTGGANNENTSALGEANAVGAAADFKEASVEESYFTMRGDASFSSSTSLPAMSIQDCPDLIKDDGCINNNYGTETYSLISPYRSSAPVRRDFSSAAYDSSYNSSFVDAQTSLINDRTRFNWAGYNPRNQYKSDYGFQNFSSANRKIIRESYETRPTRMGTYGNILARNWNKNAWHKSKTVSAPFKSVPAMSIVGDTVGYKQLEFKVSLEHQIENKIRELKQSRAVPLPMIRSENKSSDSNYKKGKAAFSSGQADSCFIRDSWKKLQEWREKRQWEITRLRAMGYPDATILNMLGMVITETVPEKKGKEKKEDVGTNKNQSGALPETDSSAAPSAEPEYKEGEAQKMGGERVEKRCTEYSVNNEQSPSHEPNVSAQFTEKESSVDKEYSAYHSSTSDWDGTGKFNVNVNKDDKGNGSGESQDKKGSPNFKRDQVPVFQSLFERFEETVHILVRNNPKGNETSVDENGYPKTKTSKSSVAEWREENESKNKAIESFESSLAVSAGPVNKPWAGNTVKDMQSLSQLSCASGNSLSCQTHETSSTTITLAASHSLVSTQSSQLISVSNIDVRKSSEMVWTKNPLPSNNHENKASPVCSDTSVNTIKDIKQNVSFIPSPKAKEDRMLNGSSVDPITPEVLTNPRPSFQDVIRGSSAMFQKVDDTYDPQVIRGAKAAFFNKMKSQADRNQAFDHNNGSRTSSPQDLSKLVRHLDAPSGKSSVIATESLSELMIDFIRNNGTPV